VVSATHSSQESNVSLILMVVSSVSVDALALIRNPPGNLVAEIEFPLADSL